MSDKVMSFLKGWGRRPKGLFGKHLQEVERLCEGEMPLVVLSTLDYIEKHALDVEGIHRISGSTTKVAALKKSFDHGESPPLDDQDPYCVAGVLSTFLRQLPEPVLTFDLYESFLTAQSLHDKSKKLKALRNLLRALPSYNLSLLRLLISHMALVASHSSTNRMSIANLAIVFGPFLLRSRVETLESVLADNPRVTGCVLALVHERELLFDDEFGLVESSDEEDRFGNNEDDRVLRDLKKRTAEIRSSRLLSSPIADEPMETDDTGSKLALELNLSPRASMRLQTSTPPSKAGQALTSSGSWRSLGSSPLMSPEDRDIAPFVAAVMDSVMFSMDATATTSFQIVIKSAVSDREQAVRAQRDRIAAAFGALGSSSAEDEDVDMPASSSPVSAGLRSPISDDLKARGQRGSRISAVVAKRPASLSQPQFNASSNFRVDGEGAEEDSVVFDSGSQLDKDKKEMSPTDSLLERNRPQGLRIAAAGEKKAAELAKDFSNLAVGSGAPQPPSTESPTTAPASLQLSDPTLAPITKQKPTTGAAADKPGSPAPGFELESQILASVRADKSTVNSTLILKHPLLYIRTRLKVLRTDSGLPEPLEQMNVSHLKEEKALLKRELKNYDKAFEQAYKREPLKQDKEPLREIYSRYKNVKSQLSKLNPNSSSPDAMLASDTPPAVNPSQLNQTNTTPQHTPAESGRAVAAAPATSSEKDVGGDADEVKVPKEVLRYLANDMSYIALKTEKRDLQKRLHDYQNQFFAKHGRKVLYRSDRLPMEAEYERYKLLRSQLHLVESETAKKLGL